MKIVYTLPFVPVVRSRSLLGLGLPSSASGNCEWSLPVHWNCLFVSDQGVFNVSLVSGRSALIWFVVDLLYTHTVQQQQQQKVNNARLYIIIFYDNLGKPAPEQ